MVQTSIAKKEELNKHIKTFTKKGFKKSNLDNELFKKLNSFYKEKKDNFTDEFVAGGFIQSDVSEVPSSLLDLTDDLRQDIHSSLKKPLEEWSQSNLEPTFVYGIRDYKEGAVLVPHRDRENTHIISAIINIAKDVDEDWPLVIEDHFYRKHEIFLDPGEVVFYESARLLHGRPYPLNGKSFANIFCHYRPID
jgi:prolyl 4-hydroxylase